MIETYIYMVEDFLFLCTGIMLLYLFVLAVASHFKHINYPKAKKQYHCAILVPETSVLPEVYKDEPYEFIVYKDLAQTIQELDSDQYQLVVLLSDSACELSPQFLDKIYNAYDAGIQAIQLHTIIKNRKGIRTRFCAISEEINNSLFKRGNTQLGFSAALFGKNMVMDLKWLQKNQRSIKTNLERKLFRQRIYIEYLPNVIVYCESAPTYPYRKRIRKELSFLFPSILEGNWNFCNRIVQQLIPSPVKLYTIIFAIALLITGFNWTFSIKWWIVFLSLSVIYSLAIPDYLVEDKKKKKHSIWRKVH